MAVFAGSALRKKNTNAAPGRLWPLGIATLVKVAIVTGLRRGELLALALRDVEEGWVRRWKTKTKTPRSFRSPPNQWVLRSLIIHGMSSIQELRWFWEKARTEMGLAEDRYFVFHAVSPYVRHKARTGERPHEGSTTIYGPPAH